MARRGHADFEKEMIRESLRLATNSGSHSEVALRIPQNSETCSQNRLFTPRLFFGVVPELLNYRVFLNPFFLQPVVCTLDFRGFRHCRGSRDFR